MNKVFPCISLFICVVIITGCTTVSHYYTASFPTIGELADDFGQQRINHGDILLHVQPLNEVQYKETEHIWLIPIATKIYDKRLTKKWPPLIVEFFVYAKTDGYVFMPKDIKLSINGQKSIRPSDISGPFDRTEHASDWTISLDEALGRIRCKTNMSKEVINRGIDVEIGLSEKNWLCYELYYDTNVPLPTDDVVILVEGMKKNGKDLLIPVMTYREGKFIRLSR
ncbi:MAG: hypothetical protein COB30_002940 [Ectothiorhodospiraceae bacterium]|nr:hypothetical protein [Ectothiorhodospiraceae bacterium]